MHRLHKNLLAAGLVASLGLSAVFAQTPPAGRPHDPARMEQHIAKMKERRAQKFADLKAKLQITAAQEVSWNTWVAAMQPPARDHRAERAQYAAMTTPERIDFMAARQAERAAAMQERGEVTKSFYRVLSAEQQKVFDAETLRRGHGGRHHGDGRGKPRG